MRNFVCVALLLPMLLSCTALKDYAKAAAIEVGNEIKAEVIKETNNYIDKKQDELMAKIDALGVKPPPENATWQENAKFVFDLIKANEAAKKSEKENNVPVDQQKSMSWMEIAMSVYLGLWGLDKAGKYKTLAKEALTNGNGTKPC